MFKSVIVPLDLEEPSSWSKALPVAVDMAKVKDASLTLGTIIPNWDAAREAQWSPLGLPRMIRDAELRLRRIAAGCELDQYGVSVGNGAIGPGILDLAEQSGADLIVLASHRPGLKDYLIGANALHVVRHAKCSVFVVRE